MCFNTQREWTRLKGGMGMVEQESTLNQLAPCHYTDYRRCQWEVEYSGERVSALRRLGPLGKTIR